MQHRSGTIKPCLIYCLVFCLLVVFYGTTRPGNHAESYDSLTFALFAQNYSLGAAPDSRNILFHALNRVMVVGSAKLGLGIETLDLIAYVNIVAASLSIILFARLMQHGFRVSQFSSWAGAVFLGLTYGFWRYAGSGEVYVASICLILCTLNLIITYIDDDINRPRVLVGAGTVAGLAILYYQPGVIALVFAVPILFIRPFRPLAASFYLSLAMMLVLAGIVWSFVNIHGSLPTVDQLVGYANSRYEEFNDPPTLGTAIKKMTLAAGHDVLSAHWTRTLDQVRLFLDPYIPGCVYNFNVVTYAGKGIQWVTCIAAILFVPILVIFGRLGWSAFSTWKLSVPETKICFVLAWLALMTTIVAMVDPGSFEAWIPVLLPVSILFTKFVIEPCYQMGKRKTMLVLLAMMLVYNFCGGLLIWQNKSGDYFYHKTAWARENLTFRDTVLFNEHDYRIVDYLTYHSDIRVAYLTGIDAVTLGRNTPDIFTQSISEFFTSFQPGERLFVFDDVLQPDPAIVNCRYGAKKIESGECLANLLRESATMTDRGVFGSTHQIALPLSLADTE